MPTSTAMLYDKHVPTSTAMFYDKHMLPCSRRVSFALCSHCYTEAGRRATGVLTSDVQL